MIFKKIYIENWKQFDKIDIEFNDRLTVITGANGAGKSTLLRVLGRLLGWSFNEIVAPSSATKSSGGFRIRKLRKKSDAEPTNIIGSIEFMNNQSMSLHVPITSNHVSYDISLVPHLQQRGINIPSHRTQYSYRAVQSIPVRAHTRDEAFSFFSNSLRSRSLGDWGGNETPSYHMKASLISLAVFGGGNDYVIPDTQARALFLGFIEILRKLLPETIGFQNLLIREGEVVLETRTGEFLLDSVSGGIGAILDLAWQIFMYDSDGNNPFFVIIDEAENHLHASMQRRLLPNLIEAFPNVQFIITTHSPLMVNSVKNSSVYVLNYNEENSVYSQLLDFENKAANASQVLREILGVPVTMPIWVEEALDNVLSELRGKELTAESYLELKGKLAEIGLSDHLPQALEMIQGE
ncbi:AAA family ATPase [Paenibacillus amylolyticus]|uniref:AAA family ATPase n=1 Tax=Paenibacillus amylolyticus TaxID=1451 RepID=UPI000B846813|nr:AAA family ATPase [Paenibacillus amylolyticus]